MKTDGITKSKDRASRRYPIDFVVPLQLEECVHRLGQLSKKETEGIHIQIQRTDSRDRRLIFTTQHLPRKSAVYAELSLDRWEGVSTRVQGHVTYTTQVVWRRLLDTFIGFLVFATAILTVYMVIVWLVVSIFPSSTNIVTVIVCFFLTFVVCILMAKGIFIRNSTWYHRQALTKLLKSVLSDS